MCLHGAATCLDCRFALGATPKDHRLALTQLKARCRDRSVLRFEFAVVDTADRAAVVANQMRMACVAVEFGYDALLTDPRVRDQTGFQQLRQHAVDARKAALLGVSRDAPEHPIGQHVFGREFMKEL